MESRRGREKESRKNLIIDTAEKVFSTKGYDLTTMDEIAKLSEFTKKSLYSYFPTKDELFAAVILRASETLDRLFSEAFSSGSSGFDKIAAIGDAYVRFYGEYPAYFKVLSLRRYGGSEQGGAYRAEIEKHWAETFRVMVASLTQGQKDGTIRRDVEPRMAALHVMSVSNGILELVTNAGGEFPGRFGMSAEDFIRNSLKLIGDSIKVQKK